MGRKHKKKRMLLKVGQATVCGQVSRAMKVTRDFNKEQFVKRKYIQGFGVCGVRKKIYVVQGNLYRYVRRGKGIGPKNGLFRTFS